MQLQNLLLLHGNNNSDSKRVWNIPLNIFYDTDDLEMQKIIWQCN